jgi:hypothetical protein
MKMSERIMSEAHEQKLQESRAKFWVETKAMRVEYPKLLKRLEELQKENEELKLRLEKE